MINLFDRLLRNQKYQQFAGWTFRGNFFTVWLKWMLIANLITIPFLLFVYFPHLPDWKFVRIVPLINAYTATIPAMICKQVVPKEEKDTLKEQFKKTDELI